MTITEILQIADTLVFSQTGKYADDLQKAVIKGVWEGQTYEKISEECSRSEGRVRDVGYKLWEILSQQLGETVNKGNFRSTFERLQLTSSRYNNINIQSSRDFTFCSYPPEYINIIEKKSENNSLYYHNLKQAPRVTKCYGRNQELSNLTQKLENPNINLISVLGIGGIGKSTLVRNIINNSHQSFDVIVWKNLKLSQTLQEIITEILINLNSAVKTSEILNNNSYLTLFLEILSEKRCLIILDNFEEIFTPQQLAGQYKPEYQNYQAFLQMITEMDHQSCLILISREKCQEMRCLNGEFSYDLELSGLDETAKNILQQQELKNAETWLELIDLYEGNPKFLQDISMLIKELFNGYVADFLKNNFLLTENMKNLFDSIWSRLSDVERNILLDSIKRENLLLDEEQINQSLTPSYMDRIKGLQSLKQRFLLINSADGLNVVSPMFKEYIMLYRQIQ